MQLLFLPIFPVSLSIRACALLVRLPDSGILYSGFPKNAGVIFRYPEEVSEIADPAAELGIFRELDPDRSGARDL